MGNHTSQIKIFSGNQTLYIKTQYVDSGFLFGIVKNKRVDYDGQ